MKFNLVQDDQDSLSITFDSNGKHSLAKCIDPISKIKKLQIDGEWIIDPKNVFLLVEYCRRNNVTCTVYVDKDVNDQEVYFTLDPSTLEYIKIKRKKQ